MNIDHRYHRTLCSLPSEQIMTLVSNEGKAIWIPFFRAIQLKYIEYFGDHAISEIQTGDLQENKQLHRTYGMLSKQYTL